MSVQRINLELSDDNYFFIRKIVSSIIRFRVENKIKGRVSQKEVINKSIEMLRHNEKLADQLVEELANGGE